MSYDQQGQSGYPNNPQGWGSDDDAQHNPWSNPQGQVSASQPSANQPTPQPSAGYPESQTSAPYPTAYGYGGDQQGQPQQQPQPGQQAQQAQQAWPAQQAGGWSAQQQPGAVAPGGWDQQPGPQGPPQKNAFAAAFDLSFGSYAAPGIAKLVYILGMAVGVLNFLAGFVWILRVNTAMSALARFGGGGTDDLPVGSLISWLLFGGLLLAFWVMALRMSLEFVLATVRTQQDTAALRAKQEG